MPQTFETPTADTSDASTLDDESTEVQALVEAQLRRRRAIRRMRALREKLNQKNPDKFNQDAVSKRMGLSRGQPTIARLESGTGDPILSTMERYAAALGGYIDMYLVDAEGKRLTEPLSVPLPEDAAPIESKRDLAAREHPYKLPDALAEKSTSATKDELNERERQILDWVADGAANTDIAKRLHLTPGTVRTHLVTIFSKLGVGTGADVILPEAETPT